MACVEEQSVMRTAFVVLLLSLLLAGCRDTAKLSDLSNGELASKNDECLRQQPTSPGRVTACENIRKECAKRRAKGNYSC